MAQEGLPPLDGVPNAMEGEGAAVEAEEPPVGMPGAGAPGEAPAAAGLGAFSLSGSGECFTWPSNTAFD